MQRRSKRIALPRLCPLYERVKLIGILEIRPGSERYCWIATCSRDRTPQEPNYLHEANLSFEFRISFPKQIVYAVDLGHRLVDIIVVERKMILELQSCFGATKKKQGLYIAVHTGGDKPPIALLVRG